MPVLDLLYENLMKGRAPETGNDVERALSQGLRSTEIIAVMNSAMEEVGLRFSRNEIFLPEMMVAARAMKAGMKVLEPILAGSSGAKLGKIVLGTIEGDLHDIGKNLVGTLFRGAGFEVIDIGIDVSKERFLESLRRESAPLVGICALLTTTLPNLKDAVAYLRDADADGDFKILVGGAAVDGEFAERVGADGYADDAGAAIQVAKRLLGHRDPG